MYRIWNRIARKENLLLAALLVCTTMLLVYQGWLWRLDQFLYDAQTQFWERPAPDDIVIIAVDKDSLEELGNWPWPLQYHASVLEQISRDDPLAISFNFPLSEESNNKDVLDRDHAGEVDEYREGEPAGIINAQEETDRAVAIQKLSPYISIPEPDYLSVVQDVDGYVRSVILLKDFSGRPWTDLNLTVSGRMDINPVTSRLLSTDSFLSDTVSGLPPGSRQIYIPYAGSPGHFQQISYHSVLNGEAGPDAFTGKYVLIGIMAPVTGRGYPTPVSGFTDLMYNVEISANILDAIRSGTNITPVTTGQHLAFSGMFALIPFLLFPFFTPRGNALVAIILISAAMGLGLLSIQVFHSWLPPAAAVIAVAFSYLMWSSRRLQNAVHYLGNELSQLNEEQVGREVDMTSRLGSAFTFLANILPIAGWYVTDREGNIALSHGKMPRSPIAGRPPVPGHRMLINSGLPLQEIARSALPVFSGVPQSVRQKTRSCFWNAW